MAFVIEMEAEPGFRHPAKLEGRVSDHKGVGLDGFGYNRPGANECEFTDVVAADNGGVGTDGGTAFHGSAGILIAAVHVAARVDHVGKDTGWSQKDIVFTDDTRINRDVILDFYIVAKHHTG